MLGKNDNITIRSNDGIDCTFVIEKIISSGGSSICYLAERLGTGEKGYLKEFIPSYYAQNEKSAYLKAYKNIAKARNNGDTLLNNFIPHTELFDVVDGGAYIWTPEPIDAINFKDYLGYTLIDPIDRCEQKLLNIIRIITTLSKCAYYLHETGFLCLDFKPENMAVEKEINAESINDINASKISYYDLDSFVMYKEEKIEPMGTPGYCAPEVKCGYADERSDIYSIGAILYNATIILMDEEGRYYNDLFVDRKKYSHISNNVQDSFLIKNSIINSNEEIKALLISVLKKSLHFNPNKRYSNCLEMIADLEKITAMLMPNEIINKLGFNKYIVISDINNSLRSINIDAILQLHLWKRPLFNSLINNNAGVMRVLIIGSGDIIFRYIDMVLLCQMYKVNPEITVLTDNADKKRELYCRFRPAARRLLNINGLNPELDEKLSFLELKDTNNIRNKSFINSIHESLGSDEEYDHVFVSLGDENLNKTISILLKDNEMVRGDVNYISYDDDLMDDMNSGIYPIIINEDINSLSDDPEFADMERMAFNTHVIWMGLENVSENDYFDFRKDTYSYNASLRFALSVKYKLFSVGVNLGQEDQREKLKEELKNLDRKELYKISDVEHRRWVYSYLIDGWDAPFDMNGSIDYRRCINESLKVKGNNVVYASKIGDYKLHACMVQGSDSDLLEQYSADDWNQPSDKDDLLDPLDRVSVELYRTAVDRVKNNDSEYEGKSVKRINYKLYDVILMERLYDIIFSKHLEGLYDYVPQRVGNNEIKISEVDSNHIEKVSRALKEYINRLMYDKGWRYGDSFSYEKKRTPAMTSFDRMSIEEQSEFKDIVDQVIKIINE